MFHKAKEFFIGRGFSIRKHLQSWVGFQQQGRATGRIDALQLVHKPNVFLLQKLHSLFGCLHLFLSFFSIDFSSISVQLFSFFLRHRWTCFSGGGHCKENAARGWRLSCTARSLGGSWVKKWRAKQRICSASGSARKIWVLFHPFHTLIYP